MRYGLAVFLLLTAAVASAAQRCHLALTDTVDVSVPGRAFSILPTPDGCWLFVSMDPRPDGSGGGLAVIDLHEKAPKLIRTVSEPAKIKKLAGMALTHDGRFLVVGSLGRILVYDVQKLVAGDAEPLSGKYLPKDKETPLYFAIAITSNDRFLFVDDHNGETVSVINLEATRRSNFKTFAIVGDIPVGFGSNSLVLSPDEKYLYATSQIANNNLHWQKTCRPPGAPTAAPNHLSGVVQMIDMARAFTDPMHSILTTTAAGCDPVRFILDRSGKHGYVTSRSDDQLLIYDASLLARDPDHSRLGSIATRTGPVGIAFVDSEHIAVANAVRFAGGKKDTEGISIIDVGKSHLHPQVVYTVPSAGPVDIALLPNRKTLVVANYEPEQVTFFRVRDLMQYYRRPGR